MVIAPVSLPSKQVSSAVPVFNSLETDKKVARIFKAFSEVLSSVSTICFVVSFAGWVLGGMDGVPSEVKSVVLPSLAGGVVTWVASLICSDTSHSLRPQSV
jgi:cation transporter-like permease